MLATFSIPLSFTASLFWMNFLVLGQADLSKLLCMGYRALDQGSGEEKLAYSVFATISIIQSSISQRPYLLPSEF